MIVDSIYISALMIGLLGGTHCVGICGGIVTALTIGSVSEHYGFGMQVPKILTLSAASVMIFLGLYLTGLWKTAIIMIGNIGSVLWHRVESLAKKIIPIRSISHVLIASILWGWLPFGLVYLVLFLTMSEKSRSQGAPIIWSFGIGTLPVLLGLG